jgi:CRP-like cAMP-binding protein
VSGLVQSTHSNLVLAKLAAEDFAAISEHLEPVELPLKFSLGQRGEPIEFIYFPTSGIASILASSEEEQVEVGLFGPDGFSSVEAVLGSDRSVHTSFMQVAGAGHRITHQLLLRLLAERSLLYPQLLSFVHTLYAQTSYTALSNAVHMVDERLARWLLMCHDRSEGDEMPLTHEFLSVMLAVRRPSVTSAIHVLEGNHFISAERGYITIRRREAMEEFASAAYGQAEQEYRRLIGPLR